jgi:hypothetical protein
LSAWEAAEQAAHGATDDDIVNCGSQTSAHTADATYCAISGWTGKTTGTIQIIGDVTSGAWDDTKYRIVPTPDAHCILSEEDNLQIRRVQARQNQGGASYKHGLTLHGTGCVVDGCIVRGQGKSIPSCYGIQDDADGSTKTVTIRNTVVYGFYFSVWFFTGTTVELDNCSIATAFRGISRIGSATVTAKNTYVGNCDDAEYDGTVTRTTCAHASSTSYSGSTANVAYSTANFTNVTTNSEDFHLVDDSPLIGVGTDLSTTFTTDITGATRTTWDIGAFLYVEEETGQFARPVSDVAAGGWTASTGSDLYAMVDESAASDADYITSGAAPAADTAVMTLGTLSTPVAGTVTLRIRAKYN